MHQLKTHNFTDNELKQVFVMFDEDESGTISVEEFSHIRGPEGLVAGAARTGAAVMLQIFTLAGES